MTKKKNSIKIKITTIYTISTIALTVLVISLLAISWNHYPFEMHSNQINDQQPDIIQSNEERFQINQLDNNLETVREYNITADVHYKKLYENESTKMYLFNGQYPGETIRANVGDTVKINFTNNLPEESSVHWHGLQVENSMDGVPGVTQEAVKPGESFLYEFKVETPGTYWYHPHQNTPHQVEMGLYGALIVDEEKESINADKDMTLMLDDIRLDENYEIMQGTRGMDVMHGRHGNILSINGNSNFNFKANKGEIIRLRLINPANARTFNFEVENHELLVIGEDIDFVKKPYKTDNIQIASGQRYDILLYINQTGNISYFTKTNQGQTKLGNIEVSGEANEDKYEHYKNLQSKILNENIPDWTNLTNEKSDYTMTLEPSRMRGNEFQWTINEKSSNYEAEKINLSEGKLYKMTLKNQHGQVHPMHIHGQKFQIISRNGKEQESNAYKDTVLVQGGEEVEIAFIAEGKGRWVNHCHILEHAEAGMLMEFIIN